MNILPLPLLGSGFLLGWSVAWPPGPINAEIARRCMAGGFWAGFGLILGACAGDALWAVLVAIGIGTLFTGPLMHMAMGLLSVVLLMGLAIIFIGGAWRALQVQSSTPAAPSRFDSSRASFLLGVTMALTSPWNIAFWIAAVGRPELTRYGTATLLAVTGAIVAGALAWGLVWSGSVVLLNKRVDAGRGNRWWDVCVKATTGALMLYFAFTSARELFAA
jgi:threonine/homoserine/homoserine lactone efflux protein